MIRRKRVRPRDYLIAGGLSVLLLVLLFAFWGIFKKEEIARQAAEESRKELALLAAREATLAANIADLRTERGRETSLRETYGVAKPGEEVIIVVDPPEETALQELSWWRKFLGWFGL